MSDEKKVVIQLSKKEAVILIAALVVGVIGGLIGGCCSQFGTKSVVKAHEFRVLDENGLTRGTLKAEEGSVGLHLTDKDMRQLLTIGVTDGSVPVITCTDEHYGSKKLAVQFSPWAIFLADKDGKQRILLMVDYEGEASIGVRDKQGKVMFQGP